MKQQTEDRREKNRREFPEISKIMDRVRKHFGPGVKLLHAKEGSREVGKVPDWWKEFEGKA